MAVGDIIGEIAFLDFDLTGGTLPKIIHVAGTTYAIAYQGYDTDGYLVTVPIENNGNIGVVINSLEFDTVNGIAPWIIHIAGDVYAIAYVGPGSNGTLKTLHIADDGTIGAVINTFVYDLGATIIEPVIVHIAGNVYAIFYGGPDNDGWLKTVTINDDGIIGGEISFLEFDLVYGLYADPIRIAGNVWAFAYTADATFGPGRIKTLTIADDGTIVPIASYDYEPNQTSPPDIFHIFGNVYGIAYGGPGFDGWLKTVTINNDGSIGTVIASLEFDPSNGTNPWVMPIGSNVWCIAYTGPGSDGWMKTVTINNDGTIDGIVSSFEYDDVSGRHQSMVHINEDVYAIAYFGPGSDGWLKTVEIETITVPTVTTDPATEIS